MVWATEVVVAPTVSVAAIFPAAGEGTEMPSVEDLEVQVDITAPARDPVEAVAHRAWDLEVAEAEVAVVAGVGGDSLRA